MLILGIENDKKHPTEYCDEIEKNGDFYLEQK